MLSSVSWFRKTVPSMMIGIVVFLFPACNSEGFKETPSGLKYKVLKEGKANKIIEKGNVILLHEKMWYTNDSLLFDSRTLPGPVKTEAGASQVIAGVDEALIGMRTGEIKRLIIPPHLSRRTGDVEFPHPDSTLIYEIEIMEIK